MNRLMKTLAVASLAAGVFAMVGCSDEVKEPPKKAEMGSSTSTSSVMTTPGEAGGIAEDTFTATATVTAIDPATRSVTLTGEADKKATFTCGPEIKNFDQLKVGDKVTAEVTERMTVFVSHESADPTVTHAAALASAPKGAKPGMMVGQVYEVTAKVTAIDAANRKATLQFSEGQTREVPVRADVDLTQYHVGDTVVIRVSEALSILTKAS